MADLAKQIDIQPRRTLLYTPRPQKGPGIKITRPNTPSSTIRPNNPVPGMAPSRPVTSDVKMDALIQKVNQMVIYEHRQTEHMGDIARYLREISGTLKGNYVSIH